MLYDKSILNFNDTEQLKNVYIYPIKIEENKISPNDIIYQIFTKYINDPNIDKYGMFFASGTMSYYMAYTFKDTSIQSKDLPYSKFIELIETVVIPIEITEDEIKSFLTTQQTQYTIF